MLASLFERALVRRSLLAQPIEARRDFASFFRLATTLLVQRRQLGLDGAQPVDHQRRESLERKLRTFELDATRFGLLPFGDVAGEALFDLLQPTMKESAALVECGGADLDVGSQRADRGGPFFEPAPHRAHLAASLERTRLVRFE